MPIFRYGVIADRWASRHHTADWAMAHVAFILPIVKDQHGASSSLFTSQSCI
ncbi:hypothetical protein [Bacillus sp. MRMR6]|uniref:hypothetical protein n=1 Tax=Bacillus sp. MRMR6 TaxID=1928617 RepID=UPI00158B6C17|nr:hypothetical protein [Bacillus sp. MRMR6]